MKVLVGSRRVGRGTPSRGNDGPGEFVFHKFKIGQEVEYSPPRGNYAPRGMYLVTRLLPERDGQFEYVIKCFQETYERIARESELRGTSATLARN